MAGTLLRIGLRCAPLSRAAIERNSLPLFSIGMNRGGFGQEPRKFPEQRNINRFYSKRNVHHTGISASVDIESDTDSDSDREGERGQSAFWRRKMRTLHSHLDVNKDGVVSYEDFMLLADRFSELGHLSPEARLEFRKILSEMWEEQWGEISPYNLVCVEKYLDEMHHVLNDPSLKRKCHHFLPFLFKAVDKDRSGEISVEEFKLFFQCLELSNDAAVVSFSRIDTNDDGRISLEEFVTLGRDFFLTEDQTRPSKYFWGPLVD